MFAYFANKLIPNSGLNSTIKWAKFKYNDVFINKIVNMLLDFFFKR